MPYVMIPAFPPSHQPLPVTPDSQLALPIQPIPCKPGEHATGGPEVITERRPGATLIHRRAGWPFRASFWGLSGGRMIPRVWMSLGESEIVHWKP